MTTHEPNSGSRELERTSSHFVLLSGITAETKHDGTVHSKSLVRQGELGELATWNLAWLDPGQRLDEHSHPDCQEMFLFFGDGDGVMTVAGEDIRVNLPGLVTVNPGEKHTLSATGSSPLSFMTMRAFVKGAEPA